MVFGCVIVAVARLVLSVRASVCVCFRVRVRVSVCACKWCNRCVISWSLSTPLSTYASFAGGRAVKHDANTKLELAANMMNVSIRKQLSWKKPCASQARARLEIQSTVRGHVEFFVTLNPSSSADRGNVHWEAASRPMALSGGECGHSASASDAGAWVKLRELAASFGATSASSRCGCLVYCAYSVVLNFFKIEAVILPCIFCRRPYSVAGY